MGFPKYTLPLALLSATLFGQPLKRGGYEDWRFGYTFYLSGGTYYAKNNVTGSVEYSDTDAGAVIRSAISAQSGTCGHLYFSAAVYNINSLIKETAGGYSHYYGIGFPSSAAAGYKCQWSVEGDSTLVPLDQFAAPAQTNGAIFYVTPTAIASVPANSEIMGFWTRPDDVYIVGPVLSFKNIGVRFPNNQRGSETAINSTQAASVDYESIMADFATAENDLVFPVAGLHGLYGITTTDSSHEQNYMRNTYAFGYDHCLDVQSEHSVLINSYGVRCNYAIDYGVRGAGVLHASSWMSSGWGESAHGLTLGSMMQNGSILDISGLDIEDATTGIWVPVAHGTEAHSGYTSGRISYSRVNQAIGLAPLAVLFDGGGGVGFTFSGSAHSTSLTPGSYSNSSVTVDSNGIISSVSSGSSGAGGSGAVTACSDVHLSRAIGTVYQNASMTQPLFIYVIGVLGNQGNGRDNLKGQADESSPPTTYFFAQDGLTGTDASGTMVVLPQNYYKVSTNSGGGSVDRWTECQ